MKLFSWGSNSHGQLAQGQSDDLNIPTEIVQSPCSFEDIVSITGGGGHSLLFTKNGLVYSSGAINKDECCQDDKMYNTFLEVSGLSSYKITQVTAGWDFSIALTDEGHVFAWGSNTFGQLGVTGTVKSLLPIEISIKAEDSDSDDKSCTITQVVAGMRHSMALTISGDVFVWGAGRRGQLGLKNAEKLPTKLEKPKKLNSITGVQSLAAGAFHSGALLKDGSIYVWGCNKYGQSTNMEVKMLTEPYQISSCQFPLSEKDIITELHSGWSHFLVLTEKRQVISWGRCDYGQLGRPTDLTYNNCDPKPCILEDLGLNVKQLYCGAEHNLALLGCGSLVCWGWNEHGMCGNGNEINQLRPTKVQLPEKSSILLIGAGTGHSFALCLN